jgi:superfamily I DNA/RNA helicase
VLVGDPDQAIFEFNGARPDLFKEFEAIEGSVPFPLSDSLRCPSDIAKVACHLKDSNGIIRPASNKIGQAFLIRYSDMKTDLDQVQKTLKRTNAEHEYSYRCS